MIDPTVAEWLAWGHATIAVYRCPPAGPGCGHHMFPQLADLPPILRQSNIGWRARCSDCGARSGCVTMDVHEHYQRFEATG